MKPRHPQKNPPRHSDDFLRELAAQSPFLAQVSAEAGRQLTAEESGQPYDEPEGLRRLRGSQAMSFTAHSHPERE